jgi:hypothetical protein
MALMFWLLDIGQEDLLWKECLEILQQFILIGLFVGIFIGSLYVLSLRIRRQIK